MFGGKFRLVLRVNRRRLGHFSLWVALLSGLALVTAALALQDDRISAWLAALSCALCILSCLKLLRLDPLSPAMVYLYVLSLFHLGLVVPWSLGVAGGKIPDWMILLPLTPALTLVILAFTGYQVGVTLAMWKRPRRGPVAAGPRRLYSNVAMYHFGMLIIAVGVGMFCWGVRSLGFLRFLQSTYIETHMLTRIYDPRFFVTSLQVVPIGIYLAASAAPWRKIPLVIAAAGLWTFMLSSLLAYRGFALVPLIALLAVLAKRGFRFKPALYVAGALLVLMAIPVMRATRASSIAERSIVEFLNEANPMKAFEEMGGSLRPVVHTIDLLEHDSFRWGRTYWQGLLRVLPNMALDWDDDDYVPLEDLPPSHWLTKQVAPWNYEHYGGLGFSAVAEAYMNFGAPGVLGFFLLLGVFFVWADRVDASRPTRLALWAMVLGPTLMTTRNAFASNFRSAVWGILVVLAARVAADTLQSMKRPHLHRPLRRSLGRATTSGVPNLSNHREFTIPSLPHQ